MEKPEDIQLTIPPRSAARYKTTYEAFLKWTKEQNHEGAVTEAILIDYFKYLVWEKKGSPGTLLSLFSMIRAVHYQSQGVDMKDFRGIMPFIRNEMKDFKPKQAAVFTREQIYRFLSKASDYVYLLQKVILILSVFGKIGQSELKALAPGDVRFDETDQEVLVVVRNPTTNKTRVVKIQNADRGIRPVDFIRKYNDLASELKEGRITFFMRYRHGHILTMRAGGAAIGATFKIAAQFLGLKDPDSYTSMSGIRTSKVLQRSKQFAPVDLSPPTTPPVYDTTCKPYTTGNPSLITTSVVKVDRSAVIAKMISEIRAEETLTSPSIGRGVSVQEGSGPRASNPPSISSVKVAANRAQQQHLNGSSPRVAQLTPQQPAKDSKSLVEMISAQNKLLMQIVAQNQQAGKRSEQIFTQNEAIIAQNNRIIGMMEARGELTIAEDDDPFGCNNTDPRSSMEDSEFFEEISDEWGLQEGVDYAYADDEAPIRVKMEADDEAQDEEQPIVMKVEVEEENLGGHGIETIFLGEITKELNI